MNMRTVVLLSLLFFPAGVHGGTIRHDANPQWFLNLATFPALSCVGQLTGYTALGGYFCSGTLIDDDWVLTAAHCLDNVVDADFTIGDQVYTADYWVSHPSWNPNDFFRMIRGHDIGLLHLSEPVESGIVPARRYEGMNEKDQAGIISGYGSTGTGLTGATDPDYRKRAGMNMIDQYFLGDAQTSRIMLTDLDHPQDPSESKTGSAVPLLLEYLVAPGDSGGPVFLADDEGIALAGVNSFVLGLDLISNSDYGDLAAHTRVTMFNDWIEQAMSSYSPGMSPMINLLSDTPQSGWTGSGQPLAIPEPVSIMVLLSVGVILLPCRRRGVN